MKNVAASILGALGLLPAIALAAPAGNAAVDAVAALEQRRVKALVEGDVKTLDEIMDDSISIVQQSGARPTKAQFLADQARGEVVFDLFRIDENDIRIFGDVAVAAGSYSSRTGGPSGAIGRARHLRVYVNRAGRWKLIAQQATEITPPRAR